MIHCAIPLFSVADSVKAEDYYCNVLGFQKLFAYRPAPDKSDPCYLGVARDGVTIHLESFKPEHAGHGNAYLRVSDVDELHAEFSARGALCKMPPTNQTWGGREIYMLDPDGNGICFSGPEK